MSENRFDMVVSPEFKKQIKKFKDDWYTDYKKISHEETPQVDGSGRKVIKKRPDGKDYIDDAWMSERLNKHFPGWSWQRAGGISFLGSEWVCADGELCIVDERLLALGITPPIRKYWAGDAVRIQYKRDVPHTPENLVDLGDNVQSAITGAKKRAINRLCGIGDDIYGKRMEEDGAGSLEDVLATTLDNSTAVVAFNELITQRHLAYSRVFEILKIGSMAEIKDFKKAYEDLKKELDKEVPK